MIYDGVCNSVASPGHGARQSVAADTAETCVDARAEHVIGHFQTNGFVQTFAQLHAAHQLRASMLASNFAPRVSGARSQAVALHSDQAVLPVGTCPLRKVKHHIRKLETVVRLQTVTANCRTT